MPKHTVTVDRACDLDAGGTQACHQGRTAHFLDLLFCLLVKEEKVTRNSYSGRRIHHEPCQVCPTRAAVPSGALARGAGPHMLAPMQGRRSSLQPPSK